MLNPGFWKNKKIFLTGHTGFKGSWLSLWLQHLGAEVTGYSLSAPTKPSLFEVADVAKGMNSIIGDVQHFDQLKETLAKSKAEIVIHMAAQSLVRYSYSNPIETYQTNVMGTVNLLEAVRQSQTAEVVVNITSDKCYENKETQRGFKEDDPMGGHDPYSSSKGCAELVTAAYRDSYFNGNDSSVALASGRAGNVIGGGDWALDRLIPDIMNAFMENRPVVIRNPNAIRPWQHVLEPLHGYLLLAEKLSTEGRKFSSGWNFGPNDEDAKPVSWIVNSITKLWGPGASSEIKKSELHEAQYLKLDCAKAKAALAWSPKISLAEALNLTVDWYKAYQQKEKMQAYTLKQISSYQESITRS
jgi:CDP-glucose 4,6-dehydratase